MDWTLEVVILPVSDIDRAVAFYRDQVGFELDHDTTNEHMHVVQLTPRGSGCSIVFGDLPSQRQMEPGSMKGLQLVVEDAAAARQELLPWGRGSPWCRARAPGYGQAVVPPGPGRRRSVPLPADRTWTLARMCSSKGATAASSDAGAR
jgi:catechol 2,3-dioxygenase-like lactoylglutathione lyase family enzyme